MRASLRRTIELAIVSAEARDTFDSARRSDGESARVGSSSDESSYVICPRLCTSLNAVESR